MKRNRRIVSLAVLALLMLLTAARADEAAKPPAVKDQDAAIRAQINDRWKTPQRQLWKIAYHPIKGMETHSAWHVAGSIWRARVYPEWIKLDELDKNTVYEIDAVALDQNYGVIDFYVYNRQPVAK